MKTTLIDYLTIQIKRKEYEGSLHAKMLKSPVVKNQSAYWSMSEKERLAWLGRLEDCQLEIIKLNKCIEWLGRIK